MKKILPAIVLLALIGACKKETKKCWTCKYTYTGTTAERKGDTTLCDFTKTDIELRSDIKFVIVDSVYDSWMMTSCTEQ
ncbi:MAG: hypothetical protein H6551_13450 [Chitinophagales bacterium]|nr:hypothetical protein [Chitinophagaceae bacterium]MCB9066139.1 hypothetical protein [Chitinophagales bacterium]